MVIDGNGMPGERTDAPVVVGWAVSHGYLEALESGGYWGAEHDE
jgi:hypothetical protein